MAGTARYCHYMSRSVILHGYILRKSSQQCSPKETPFSSVVSSISVVPKIKDAVQNFQAAMKHIVCE